MQYILFDFANNSFKIAILQFGFRNNNNNITDSLLFVIYI